MIFSRIYGYSRWMIENIGSQPFGCLIRKTKITQNYTEQTFMFSTVIQNGKILNLCHLCSFLIHLEYLLIFNQNKITLFFLKPNRLNELLRKMRSQKYCSHSMSFEICIFHFFFFFLIGVTQNQPSRLSLSTRRLLSCLRTGQLSIITISCHASDYAVTVAVGYPVDGFWR